MSQIQAVLCKKCKRLLDCRKSTEHNIKWCKCGAVGVDVEEVGGKVYYCRLLGNSEDYEESDDYHKLLDKLAWRGWYNLYEEYTTKLKAAGAIDIYVKQKYGFMRIEYNYSDKCNNSDRAEINRLANEAEDKSLGICNECGSEEDVSQVGIWIETLCKQCIEKMENDGE